MLWLYYNTIDHPKDFDSATTGQIGDTYGGLAGPYLALIAGYLTFIAFWVQYRANEQQKIDLQLERFENKFFEFVKLHKENLNEMSIDGYDVSITVKSSFTKSTGNEVLERTEEHIGRTISGRKIFVTVLNELIACYKICEDSLQFEEIQGRERYLIKMSYRLLFSGIGTNAVTGIDEKVKDDKEHVKTCKLALIAARTEHVASSGKANIYTIPGSKKNVEIFIKYKPFSGHVTRFGHYYRHLYYLVKYVVGQPEKILSIDQKKEYLRMLRAQLSGHEQLMLYFNYLSGYGSNWENTENKFFSEYRMIHNMPLELAAFTIDPKKEFREQIAKIEAKGGFMFEYDE